MSSALASVSSIARVGYLIFIFSFNGFGDGSAKAWGAGSVLSGRAAVGVSEGAEMAAGDTEVSGNTIGLEGTEDVTFGDES